MATKTNYRPIHKVYVTWDHNLPMPLFEDEEIINTTRYVTIPYHTLKRWKSAKRKYLAVLEEIEDLAVR